MNDHGNINFIQYYFEFDLKDGVIMFFFCVLEFN